MCIQDRICASGSTSSTGRLYHFDIRSTVPSHPPLPSLIRTPHAHTSSPHIFTKPARPDSAASSSHLASVCATCANDGLPVARPRQHRAITDPSKISISNERCLVPLVLGVPSGGRSIQGSPLLKLHKGGLRPSTVTALMMVASSSVGHESSSPSSSLSMMPKEYTST